MVHEIAVVVSSHHSSKKQSFDGVNEQRLASVFRCVERPVGDPDGETSEGDEAREGEGRARERALAKGKEEELEVGEPGDEEGKSTRKVKRMESERESQEVARDWHESQQSGDTLRSKLTHGVAVTEREDHLNPCLDVVLNFAFH